MKAYSLLMVLFLCTYSGSAQRSAAEKEAAAAYDKSEKDAVTYVKAIDVKTLDPSLASAAVIASRCIRRNSAMLLWSGYKRSPYSRIK